MGKLPLILILLVVVAGGYYYYQLQSPAVPEGPSVVTAQFEAPLTDLRKLQNINFDASIFKNPLFTSLVPLPDVTPPAATAGRLNPFLPF